MRSVDWHPCNSLLASCGRDSMVREDTLCVCKGGDFVRTVCPDKTYG